MKHLNYKENWDFYMCTVEGNMASIFIDLGLEEIAPIESKQNLFWISIQMNNPKPNGLSTKEESTTLFKIEDLIVDQLKAKHNVIYVGRLTSNNDRDLYFYFGDELLIDKTVSNCMVQFANYNYDYGVKTNDNWNTYYNFLFPAPRDFQVMKNRKVLDVMKEHGDNLEKPRQVDHWLYFKTKNDRLNFINDVVKAGFKLTDADSELYDNKFRLIISREDKVGENNIDIYTVNLWELAKKHNGEYDGWETQIILGED